MSAYDGGSLTVGRASNCLGAVICYPLQICKSKDTIVLHEGDCVPLVVAVINHASIDSLRIGIRDDETSDGNHHA